MDLLPLRYDLNFNQPGWILFIDERLLEKLSEFLSQPIRQSIWESLHLIHPIHHRYPMYPRHPMHSRYPIGPIYSGGYSRKSIRNSNASVPYPEQPTLDMFKEKYRQLEFKKLLCIQYSINNGERKFLIGCSRPKYICNLCCCEVGSDFKAHFTMIVHCERLQLITEMYDPVNAVWLKGMPQILKKQLVESPLLSLFKTKYQLLEHRKLVCVQYRINNGERKFLIDGDSEKYKCNLCCREIGSKSDLKNHFDKTIHSERMQFVTEMYDPINSVWLQCIPEAKNEKILEIKQPETIVDNKKHEQTLEIRQQAKAFEIKQADKELISSSSLQGFKATYVDLDIDELLEIKYQNANKHWQYMLTKKKECYSCNLCGNGFIQQIPHVKSHFRGRLHSNQIMKLKVMYHPKYCFYQESEEDEEGRDSSSEEPVSVLEEKGLEIKKQEKTLEIQEQEKMQEIKQQERTISSQQSNEKLNPKLFSVFKKNYFYLKFDTLLDVRYSYNYKDRYFMAVVSSFCYRCQMCGCNIYSEYDLREHFKGRRHSQQVCKAVELYDPKNRVWLRESQIIVKKIEDNKPQANDDPKPLSGNELPVEYNTDDSSSLLSLFKVKYRRLDLEHLLNVQCYINDEKKLIIEHINGQYECNLCLCKLESVYSLKDHINGIAHTQKLENLMGMYDPIQCTWLQDKQKEESLHTPSNCLRKTEYEDYKIKCSTSTVEGFQYKLKNCEEWFDVFIDHGSYFTCAFCDVNKKRLRSFMTMFGHVKSMSHWNNIPKTAQIFHPEYCLQELSSNTNKATMPSSKSNQPSRKQQKPSLETKKHNLNDFKKLYVDLPIEELLEVQYQVKNEEWDFLLHEVNQRYYCGLCENVELSHEESVKDHIRSQYHSLIVNALSAMYHPTYCVSWDVESSNYDELRCGLYERNYFRLHSHRTDFEIILEEFKQNYTDLHLDELLNVQYQCEDDEWEFMFTELFDGYYCNLCNVFLYDFEYNVDIHIIEQQHLDNIKHLTALYHPEYCTFKSEELLEENENTNNISYDYEVPDSILRQFTMDYVNLSTDEMMQIAYELVENGDWEYMIHVKDKRFFCYLCGKVSLGTHHEMERHIREERHMNQVKNVSGLYHPTYCFADVANNEDTESLSSTYSELPDEKTNFLTPGFQKRCDEGKNLLVLQNELNSNASSTSQTDILIYEELDPLSTDDDFFQEHSILDVSTTSDGI